MTAEPSKAISDLEDLLRHAAWQELILPALEVELKLLSVTPIGNTMDEIAIAAISREAGRRWVEQFKRLPEVLIDQFRKKLEEKR